MSCQRQSSKTRRGQIRGSLRYGTNSEVQRQLPVRVLKSESFGFNDGLFAAVVTTFTTNGVIDVPSAAVGAESQSGGNGLVVSSAFSSASLRLFSFRMCHCS